MTPLKRPQFTHYCFAILAITSSTLAQACAPGPTVIWPVTEGFHKELPERGGHLLIWGDDATVVLTATDWLRMQGMTVIDKRSLGRIASPNQGRVPDSNATSKDALTVGRAVEASLVVFVESHYETIGLNDLHSHSSDAVHGGVPLYSVLVAVRGVDAITGKLLWSGSAEYLFLGAVSTHRIDEAFHNLTCQALATAWGLRPPGKREIASTAMCAQETTGTSHPEQNTFLTEGGSHEE